MYTRSLRHNGRSGNAKNAQKSHGQMNHPIDQKVARIFAKHVRDALMSVFPTRKSKIISSKNVLESKRKESEEKLEASNSRKVGCI